MRPGTDELTDREVHLWYVRTDLITETAALDHLARHIEVLGKAPVSAEPVPTPHPSDRSHNRRPPWL